VWLSCVHMAILRTRPNSKRVAKPGRTAGYDDAEEMESMYLISFFPERMVELLAQLPEDQRQPVAEQWQIRPEFFWKRRPGTAAEVLAGLCGLAAQAITRSESVILVASGD
jgi:hypothetical protein